MIDTIAYLCFNTMITEPSEEEEGGGGGVVEAKGAYLLELIGTSPSIKYNRASCLWLLGFILLFWDLTPGQ